MRSEKTDESLASMLFGPARAHFWVGLLGVLTGLALGGVLYFLLRPEREMPIVLEPPPTPQGIVVQIEGAVRTPGVYTFPRGSRVYQAIEAAGGALPEADLSRLNLSRPLQDGERLWVPFRGEPVTPTPVAASLSAVGAPVQVNINTASVDELAELPGIGPSLAARIVEYRETHGPFRTLEELLNVKGIGPVKLEQIRPYLTVGPADDGS